jgi:glycerophosphoryl diester phosphodiesterase
MVLTWIFAHRGFSLAYPENTMKAFIEAERAGADGIELDVQMSKDGQLVVIHDEKLDRTTGEKGFVKDLSASELMRLDARYKFKQTLVKKEPVPLLRDVLEWLSNTSLQCNIELKNGTFPYHGMEDKVIDLIRELKLEEKIILSSFNHYSIVHVNRHAPDIETAPILAEGIYMPWVYAKSILASGFHPHYRYAHDEIIKKSCQHHIAVRPYTVNNESEIQRLIKANCSAIITDDPAKAKRINDDIH